MSRKVFTAGEVLAAADVNNFLMNQTVMSFAGTASRAASIPVPVEGMYTHLEDTDQLQFWNGSAWRSPNDLVLVKSQTSGTGVSTVVVSDAFNADYDNYTIYITGGSTSAGANLSLRFGSTNVGHYEGGYRSSYGAGVLTGEFASNGDTIQRAARGSSLGVNGIVEVSQPFAARRTFYSYRGASMSTGDFGWQGSGFLNDSNSYTSFTLIPNVGTITGISITVFGNRRSI
jgi:hypothetical protein